jgi:hypothetical protein
MLEHPKYGSQFEKPEDAIFPAFWRHWMAILPHEKARGFKVNGFNELTDHKPFWEATAPFTKSEHDETDHLTIRTARQHADWVHQYGEVPAQILYARWIIPQLLEHGAKRIAPVAIRKFQELSVDLRKGFHMPDSEGPSPTPEPVHTEEAATPPPPPDETHVEFNGKRVIPGVGHYGGDMYHILEAGANHFTVVPHDAMAKIKSPTIDTPTGPMKQPWWGPHDITQIPRHSSPGTGVKETNWDIKSYPQSLDAPTKVDTHVHAVGDYLHHDDVRQMVEGFDFAQPKKWGTEGVQADSSFWGKTPDGKPVYVKKAPIEAQLNGARKEALYYNLSRDFFGLDKYVPKTALVSNPTDGTEWAIVEGHQGVHGNFDKPHPSAAQTLNAHQKTGDLDKLAIMNMISSNPDAHPMNNLYTKDGLKLLDHGHSYQAVPVVKDVYDGWGRRNGYAGYLGDHHHANGKMMSHDPEFTGFHPEAMSWLHSLDPKLLREHLVRHEVPPRLKENMIARLERLQHLTKMSPNSSRIELLHGAEYV